MHKYRTHNCNALNSKNKNQKIILSGWINKKRDHGNLLFIDLRDNFGLTQCVIDKSNNFFLSRSFSTVVSPKFSDQAEAVEIIRRANQDNFFSLILLVNAKYNAHSKSQCEIKDT